MALASNFTPVASDLNAELISRCAHGRAMGSARAAETGRKHTHSDTTSEQRCTGRATEGAEAASAFAAADRRVRRSAAWRGLEGDGKDGREVDACAGVVGVSM